MENAMSASKEPKPEKSRTTSQLWARREVIKKKISELSFELATIDEHLAAELENK
jgi:hypothetical protein